MPFPILLFYHFCIVLTNNHVVSTLHFSHLFHHSWLFSMINKKNASVDGWTNELKSKPCPSRSHCNARDAQSFSIINPMKLEAFTLSCKNEQQVPGALLSIRENAKSWRVPIHSNFIIITFHPFLPPRHHPPRSLDWMHPTASRSTLLECPPRVFEGDLPSCPPQSDCPSLAGTMFRGAGVKLNWIVHNFGRWWVPSVRIHDRVDWSVEPVPRQVATVSQEYNSKRHS